jgi:hypothetical protein
MSRYGALDIDSMPPASRRRRSPARTIRSASATARMPDAHTLLIVSEPISSGTPVASVTWRDGMWPTPAWTTWPMTAYSMSPGSTPARWNAAEAATTPSCTAVRDASAPPRRPNGVRAEERMTVSATAAGYRAGAGRRHG